MPDIKRFGEELARAVTRTGMKVPATAAEANDHSVNRLGEQAGAAALEAIYARVDVAGGLRDALADRLTEAEAVELLDAIGTDDPEAAHGDAEAVLLRAVPASVAEAFERAMDRQPWVAYG